VSQDLPVIMTDKKDVADAVLSSLFQIPWFLQFM